MNIRFGYRDMHYPSETLGTLRDSQHLLADIPALHAQMAEDGYLLLRGLIDREKVQKAAGDNFALHARSRRFDPDGLYSRALCQRVAAAPK